jgi:hypothetical protein
MTRGALIVFMKAAKAGRVKTRLGRGIGMGRAAALFRHMSAATLAEAGKGSWRKIIAVDPPGEVLRWRGGWPADFERLAQSRGDLGERMKAAMRAVHGGPVVIIGADAPGLRARHIRGAFAALGRADAVFGPADDGGYWLIGLARRRRAPELFANVRWSSRHALADTIASLPTAFTTAFLPTLQDIDEPNDLALAGPLLRSARG